MMNKHTPLRLRGSLLERASEMYDFRTSLRGPALPERSASPEREQGEVREPDLPASAPAPAADPEFELQREIAEPAAPTPRRPKQPIIMSGVEVTVEAPEPPPAPGAALDLGDDFMAPDPTPSPAPAQPRSRGPAGGRRGKLDQAALRTAGFILPGGPVTGLAEEFRIIKRQLLRTASGKTGLDADKRQTIMVCSASPGEGKTFCAINLALSLASEEELEVLLVDGDFNKPEIPSILGLENGPGLIDAISHPQADPNDFVVQTDFGRFSVLPAGRKANNVPELLASERTRQVLASLTEGHRQRIVIFDSPPVLMASPASVLASKVGQAVVVVRADTTTEARLREAVALLSGCDHVSLLLNAAGFAATGRRFGSYYGYGK
jgi:exopolysaccharide/PEP-CTERM locus tyrosine autokinase